VAQSQTQNEERIEPAGEVMQALAAGDSQAVGEVLSGLHPADIADVIEGLPPEQRPAVWPVVPTEKLGETLLEVPDRLRASVLSELDKSELVAAVGHLDIDDIADLIPELPDDILADVLYSVDKASRAKLGEVLSYPDDTAGGLMNTDALVIRENITLRVVLRYLRLLGDLPEHTDKLFVVNRNNNLVGELPVSVLLTRFDGDRVGLHVKRDPISFKVMDTQDDVASAFEKYNLLSAPVVDDENRLLGRITIDDAVDVLRDAADRSVMARAGLHEEEDLFAPVARSAKGRAIWLGVNLITALIASWVIANFEHTIEQMVALAVLMPIVASMGGNAGTQTLTVVIRGLGMGIIGPSNAWRVLKQEFLVGGLNGLLFAFLVALITILWYHQYALGVVIALAMLVNLVAAAVTGVFLPLLLRRLGVDPALAAGVALTTVTDVIGFLSLLGLATLFLL